MRINEISLVNFRGIKDLNIRPEGKCVVLYGINGVGKSSVLRSVDLIFANIISKLQENKKKLAELTQDDIYDHSEKAKIEISLSFDDDTEFIYSRSIYNNGKKVHDLSGLAELISTFREKYVSRTDHDDEEGDSGSDSRAMPIFVNYGVNRGVVNADFATEGKYSKQLDAFDNAIENRIDFRSFFKWFRHTEDIENQIIAAYKRTSGTGDDSRISLSSLTAVRNAMLSMFSEFSNVRVDRVNDTLLFEKEGETLNINQLSDGEKGIIALFGDISRRMAIANMDVLDNPNDGEGIVLIDEVDLHLHPDWQRKIVGMLRKTFPNLQFILTTHSPQVLGELGNDIVVYSLARSSEGAIEAKQVNMFGWDSNIILEEGMSSTSVSEDVKVHIDKMYEAYESGDMDAAEKEADYVDSVTGGHNDCVAGIRVLISRKKRMARYEKN